MPDTERLSDEALDALLFLSRLELSPDERSRLKRQAGEIISHFDSLSRIDTSDAQADHSGAVDAGSLRADEIGPSLPVPAMKRLSGNFLDGYFAVPKIIEGE
ncbi:MAG: Asp-tRNA(Asn)/Glu-tRNA(Gln) amidotransferase subunit GatC [Spirochaetes bacterium]|nr:Asp-tRNA(Asn)/Glu-tRNA(Gln) amidotransferase subunit GatC [Spirochaetota bacterium]